MDANATTTALLLTARDPMQCINVSLTSDGLVEETETVILTLTQTDNVTSFGSVTPSITVITIIDKDGMFSMKLDGCPCFTSVLRLRMQYTSLCHESNSLHYKQRTTTMPLVEFDF